VKGGIVELDREVVAALVRALRPGGADLGLADEHAVGRGVVVGAVGFGRDAHSLGPHATRDDLTWSSAPTFLKEPTLAI
jgi:hypothetical protein